MIKKVLIHRFRNIQKLEIYPKLVNIITGRSGGGKTNLLEAIMLADSTDTEFSTLLTKKYSDSSRKMALRELIYLGFFSHDHELESFKIEIKFDGNNRLLEIWKTNDLLSRSLGMMSSSKSPYLFVYNSVNSKYLFARAIEFWKIEQLHRQIKLVTDYWPIQYVGSDNMIGVIKLSKFFNSNLCFNRTIKAFLFHYPEILSIHTSVYMGNRTIMIRFHDHIDDIPLYSCSKSLIKILTILLSLCITSKSYFLIDDIEKDIIDKDLDWLIGEIINIAANRNIQLFITTKNTEVQKRFSDILSFLTSSVELIDIDSFRCLEMV